MSGRRHRSQPERKEFPELPPRPDSLTGQPFPPHGQAFHSKETAPEDDPTRETRVSRKPEPPPEMGPTLAWYRENAKGNVVGYIGSAAILLGGFTIISLLRGDGLDMLTAWPIWAVTVVFAYLMSSPLTFTVNSAGADWFQRTHIRPGRKSRPTFIRLYDITSIYGYYGGVERYLRISDDDYFIDIPIFEWQQDRQIWDLVYNGILHSVANGAEINREAIAFLELESTPALELARRSRDDPHAPEG